jgi:tellurium resistance protein TerD
MAISLQKGGNVSLSKEEPGLKKVIVGVGWDPRPSMVGAAFDLDASAFLLGASGKVRTDSDFVFYNNLRSEDGSVEHSGDNRTGVGEGDDERLTIDLERVPQEVARIVVAVTIHEAEARRQNFGMVAHGYIRCLNADTEREIARYDLSEDCSTETAMIFGELYRSGSEWKFRAVGQGYKGGLAPLARSFGVDA